MWHMGLDKAKAVPAEVKKPPVSDMFFKQLVPSSVRTCTDSLSLRLIFSIPDRAVGLQAATLLIAQAFSDDVEEVVLLIPQIEVVHTSPTPQSHSSFKKLPTRLWTKKISESS